MKKIFFAIFCIFAIIVFASCNGKDNKKETNPLWGMWTMYPQSDVKKEIMFNDDFTGFVFVADTVQYEISWHQENLLEVRYFDMTTAKKDKGSVVSYETTVLGDTLVLKDIKNNSVLRYLRFKE